MKIYESVLLKKIGLSIKLPRDILCTRKSALCAGLILRRIIMNMLALKFYARYNRIESNISKIININKENA